MQHAASEAIRAARLIAIHEADTSTASIAHPAASPNRQGRRGFLRVFDYARTRGKSRGGPVAGQETNEPMLPARYRAETTKSDRSLVAAAIVRVAVTAGIACVTIWDLRRDALARAIQETNSRSVLLAD